MNKNTREEKTGKAPSNSEGLQPAEIEKDRDEDKNKKRGLLLRRITVALAVLVVLSLLGLIGRALYLHFNDPADSEVTVPENHLESGDPSEETSPPDSGVTDDSAASESTEANGSAAEETDRKAAYTELFETNTVSNKKFEAKNMLPGDSVSQYYCVRTFHKESLPVYFSVKVTEETKELSKALRLRVARPETGEVLCDASFSELNDKEWAITLPANENGNTVSYYKIEAYLTTDTGNEYQAAMLKADFSWYVKAEDQKNLVPKTGDIIGEALAITLAVSAAALLALVIIKRKKEADRGLNPLGINIGIIIILTGMLTVTTYALFSSMATVQDNKFETGIVKLNLNDGKTVIAEEEYMFEPGMKVVKTFFVENQGSADAYCNLYFKNVEGDLSEVMEITVKDEEGLVYQGTAAGFAARSQQNRNFILEAGERAEMTIMFYFPEEAGNAYQDKELQFDLAAIATQVRNNPDKEY